MWGQRRAQKAGTRKTQRSDGERTASDGGVTNLSSQARSGRLVLDPIDPKIGRTVLVQRGFHAQNAWKFLGTTFGLRAPHRICPICRNRLAGSDGVQSRLIQSLVSDS